MSTAGSRSPWVVSAREARVHAAILGVVLWTLALALGAWPGPRNAFGTLKGADFAHFYTLGDIAAHQDAAALYDGPAQYDRQIHLVPPSIGDFFVPVYPPQTALVFAPLALMPYSWALSLWVVITVAIYALAIRTAGAHFVVVAQDRVLLVLAAAAFPPFWSLVLHGQSTAIPLAAFTVAAGSLHRGRRVLAGAALGLLAVKPQFALVVAFVLLWCGEWQVIAGLAASLSAQVAAAIAAFGSRVWLDYADVVRRLPETIPALEANPFQMRSLRAISPLMSPDIATGFWISALLVLTWAAVRAWRSSAPINARFSVLVLASVLANPHLSIYDATVLAVPLLGIGAWVETSRRPTSRATFWTLIYWLFPALLFPTGWAIGIQVSVVLLVVIYMRAVRDLTDSTGGASSP